MEYISITRNTKKDTQCLIFIRLLETSDREMLTEAIDRDTVRTGASGQASLGKPEFRRQWDPSTDSETPQL